MKIGLGQPDRARHPGADIRDGSKLVGGTARVQLLSVPTAPQFTGLHGQAGMLLFKTWPRVLVGSGVTCET